MARIGYLRAKRKQEIEEFESKAKIDKTFVDLTNEVGFTRGETLKLMLDQIEARDTLVIRSLIDVANDVLGLRSFIATLKELDVDLVILSANEPNILTDQGYEALCFIDDFLKNKAMSQTSMQSKIGRRSEPYPPNFLEVYEEYRRPEKENRISGLEAAKKLSVSYNKFRELIKLFELRF